MKNVFRVLGIVALVAAIGLSFAGCDTGGDSPAPAPGPAGQPPSQKTVYTWDAGESSYELVVTEASNSRAAYNPKSGDTYVLTITPGNKRSSGTVAVTNSSDDKKITLTLTPTADASKPFTVTAAITATNALVEKVDGPIAVDGGGTVQVTEEVIPTKIYATFDFTANIWDNEKSSGETWSAGIQLSDFTKRIPQQGDKFTFKFSGTTKAEMKWFGFGIFNVSFDPFDYQWIGGTGSEGKLSGTFEETFTAKIDGKPHSVVDPFNLHMENYLWQWQKDRNDYLYDNDARLPKGTKKDDVMATISNFKVSLVKVIPAE